MRGASAGSCPPVRRAGGPGRGDHPLREGAADRRPGVERARTELADEPAVLLEVLTELGKIHANLSQYETAEALLREAVVLRAALGDETPGPSLPTLLEELGSVLIERDGRSRTIEFRPTTEVPAR